MSFFSVDEFFYALDNEEVRKQRAEEIREIASDPEYKELQAKILAFWSNREYLSRDIIRAYVLLDWKSRLIPTKFVPYLIDYINSDDCDGFNKSIPQKRQ